MFDGNIIDIFVTYLKQRTDINREEEK